MANLFNIALSRSNADTKAISEKLERAKQLPASQKKTVRVGGSIIQLIANITEKMNAYLGEHRDEYLLLSDPAAIRQYITESIETGFVAIDTETTGLDTYDDDIVGMSLYSPGMKPAYIPISHVSYITGELLPGQVNRDFLRDQLNRYVEADTKTIWFNADFDIRVIRHTIGTYFHCWFDASIASRVLNENEPKGKKGLKELHKKYVLGNMEDEFKFSTLFEGVQFNYVPIDVGYLYAAKDAKITYELFEFQYKYLNPESPYCIQRDLLDVANVFWNIEMPCVEVLIDMEDTGVMIDLDVHKKLENKYIPMMNKAEADFKQRMLEYGITEQIDIASAKQLAHLFYDLLKLKSPDPKKPRGTSKDIIKKLDHPIVDALRDYRAVSTLVNTFIVRLPNDIKKDGKVHCSYKQMGTDTGRMACTKPNLQQMPAKAKDIRQMFRASPGYVLIGSDFSQQEPKMTAYMSQDEGLLKAAREGRDVYSSIAAIAFNTTYENCCEFNPDGSTNYEGKDRRSQAKSIVLGICYGRGIKSIAKQLNTSEQEAQNIYDSVLDIFKGLKQFDEDSKRMALEKGYVTTAYGRRRRLPDIRLPEYSISYTEKYITEAPDKGLPTEMTDEVMDYWLRQLQRVTYRSDYRRIKDMAYAQGINIVSNQAFKARAARQTVNARIQGSAADMTKIAMAKIAHDERLKELGFRMLIQVHDEIIGECPKETAKEAAERFCHLMATSVSDKIDIPFSTDAEITEYWYGSSVEDDLIDYRDEFEDDED